MIKNSNNENQQEFQVNSYCEIIKNFVDFIKIICSLNFRLMLCQHIKFDIDIHNTPEQLKQFSSPFSVMSNQFLL
jgi:hypothetical protein